MEIMDINDWRAKIDAIDTTLLHLLNVRAAFALEVGKLKGAGGLALRIMVSGPRWKFCRA